MTKSGITRRIDELGRIVIPKEIRSNLGIRDGELLEIFIENNSIVIKKFSQVENIKDVSKRVSEIITDVCKVDLLISDREKILVTSNKLKDLNNMNLSEHLKLLIDNRESYISNKKDKILGLEKYFMIIPIITSTDCSGLVIVVSDNQNNENLVYAKIVSKLIADSLEVS